MKVLFLQLLANCFELPSWNVKRPNLDIFFVRQRLGLCVGRIAGQHFGSLRRIVTIKVRDQSRLRQIGPT